jgi:hypothetical protein
MVKKSDSKYDKLTPEQQNKLINDLVSELVPKFNFLLHSTDPAAIIQAWLATPFVLLTSMDHEDISLVQPTPEQHEIYTHQISFINFLMSAFSEAYVDRPELFRRENLILKTPNADGTFCYVKVENLKIDVENRQMPLLEQMEIS